MSDSQTDLRWLVDAYREGESISSLSRTLGVPRSRISKVLSESLAEKIRSRERDYFHHPTFSLPWAEDKYMGDEPEGFYKERTIKKAPEGVVSPYIAELYQYPLLTPEGEKFLFEKYNYLKFRVASLCKTATEESNISLLRDIDELIQKADDVRNCILQSNLRILVNVIKRMLGPAIHEKFDEALSVGNDALRRAVEGFDVWRGNRFSTYATWAVQRTIPGWRQKEAKKEGRQIPFPEGYDMTDHRAPDINVEQREEDFSEMVSALLVKIPARYKRHRNVLCLRYGLNGNDPNTLQEVADIMGVTKENIRQMQLCIEKRIRKGLKASEMAKIEALIDEEN